MVAHHYGYARGPAGGEAAENASYNGCTKRGKGEKSGAVKGTEKKKSD